MHSNQCRRTLWVFAAVTLTMGPAVQGQLVNGSFETGDFFGWTAIDLSPPFFPLQVGPAGLTPGFGFFVSSPTDGVFAALNGFDGTAGEISIAQDLNLAANEIEVQFDYRAAWDMTFGATLAREFRVDIEPFGGGAFLQRDVLILAMPGETVVDTGGQTGLVDLSAFSGTPIRISFEWNIPESFTGPGFFQLDNVVLIEAPFADRTLIVKQGACPAAVNPRSSGVTSMVVVGDVDFDVSTIIGASLALSRCDGLGEAIAPYMGPPGPAFQIADLNHPNLEDVGCGTGLPCACNANQASDGIDDLMMKFKTSEMADAFLLDSSPSGVPITLFLTGQLTDGSGFLAADCIELVGPPAALGLLAVESNIGEVWIDVSPTDAVLDGGGFTSFERAHPEGTFAVITAPLVQKRSLFVGWIVDGQPVSSSSFNILGLSVGAMTTVEALYVAMPPINLDPLEIDLTRSLRIVR